MKIFRRFAALALALMLLPLPVRAASLYEDVPENHWAYESIRRATEYGFIAGVSPKRFGLGESVTRAQYALMLCRLMNWDPITPEKGSFSDNQDKNSWYYSAIETALAHGALVKMGQSCRPTEPLAREEMAAMSIRALGYASLAGIVQNDCPFSDVTTNPGYIALSYHMGFMQGVSAKRFMPKTASTREQAAVVLLRIYDGLHAEITRAPLSMMPAGTPAVFAESVTDLTGSIPLCPRAPLEKVYSAALAAGEGEAVALRTVPWAVEVRDGRTLPGLVLTEGELAAYLRAGAEVHRSPRYASSYLIHTVSETDKVYVWFESEEDLAEKVALCRLLGVKKVYIE